MSTLLYFYFEIIKEIRSFFTKIFTKWLKNFEWTNTRVGKGFFKEKMANLKVFIAKVCKTYRRHYFIYETVKCQGYRDIPNSKSKRV